MSQHEDMQLPCAENGCGEFTWTGGEQDFYAQKGFSAPKRCQKHREEAKRRREGNGMTERPKHESDAEMLA